MGLRNNISLMALLAIKATNKPPKAIASELKCSPSALYQAMSGKRLLPVKVMRKFSETNLLAAASIALQTTGLIRLFRYRTGDSNVFARFEELRYYDEKERAALKLIGDLLVENKADLNKDIKGDILKAVDVIVERDNASLNFLVALDIKYDLGLVQQLQKEKLCFNEQSRVA